MKLFNAKIMLIAVLAILQSQNADAWNSKTDKKKGGVGVINFNLAAPKPKPQNNQAAAEGVKVQDLKPASGGSKSTWQNKLPVNLDRFIDKGE